MKLSKDSWHYKCLTQSVFPVYRVYEIDNFCSYFTALALYFCLAIVVGVCAGLCIAVLAAPITYYLFAFGNEEAALNGVILYFAIFTVGCAIFIGVNWGKWFPSKDWWEEKEPSKLSQIYDSIKNKYCIRLEFVDKE